MRISSRKLFVFGQHAIERPRVVEREDLLGILRFVALGERVLLGLMVVGAEHKAVACFVEDVLRALILY